MPHANNEPITCKPAISSMSLGRAWVHQLPKKLACAHAASLKGLEVWFEDIEYYARESFGGDNPSQLLAAARSIATMCAERDIEIISLQPFAMYEALKDRAAHAAMIERAKLFFAVAHELGTDMILVPATFREAEALVDDLDVVVADLSLLADLGATYGMRFAYENLAWSTLTDTWEAIYDVVKKVDRANFGLCLDTFNIAARVFADPTQQGGKASNGHVAMQQSIDRMVSTIDPSKLFFVQVVDAERLSEPLVKGHEYYNAEQPARMSWSRNCRLFYGEADRGAFLPVKAILQAIFQGLGYRGWVSMELFNRSMNEAGSDVPAEHAHRAGEAWRKMVLDFKLNTD